MFVTLLVLFATVASVESQSDCFKHSTNCYACKSAGCGWCQIGTGNDISEGCQPPDRESDCKNAAMMAGTTGMWNQACPLLTPGDSPATASPGGTTVPGGTTNGASNGATGAPGSSSVNNGASGGTTTTTSTPVLTLGNGPTPGFTTAPRGGDTQKDKACNPACEICPNGSGNSASRKRACKQTWGAVKASLVGNNCGYEPGSTTTAKWTDESCVVEEKACIPPRGSTERPNYETCSNPVPCERDSPGWKCSTCYIVADDGSQQHLSPNAAPVGCDAAQLALTQALWLVGVLAAMVGM